MAAIERDIPAEDNTELVISPYRPEPYACRFVETGSPEDCTCPGDWA
jgi:hypothetical protein